ncbi:hypothetical protein WIS52_14915 [Pseudonocardia nematodicida]|uniref:Bulb-type lectin domain-containing protein n=1 Tax=Pseudonocardia nematodicida TaxID=1206997 RepID=A0ABV1KEI7_9PSEU
MRQHLGRAAALAVTALSLVGLAITTAPAAYAGGPETNNLQQNEQLNPGQRLVTGNNIALVMQSDGNLVEYAPGNRAVWASGTNRAGSVLKMQSDGNLVIIAPGNVPVWATGTGGNPGAGLELQTDGNAVVYAQGHVAKWANGVNLNSTPARDLANTILNNRNIALQTVHVSGVRDNATARQNVVDTAEGRQAARSAYGGAPGGSVALDTRMLSALQQIGSEGGLRVSEIAGGSHSAGSKHYDGRAFDLDQYGGRSTTTIVNRCKQLGASYAAFENGNHVHCQW